MLVGELRSTTDTSTMDLFCLSVQFDFTAGQVDFVVSADGKVGKEKAPLEIAIMLLKRCLK